MFPDVAVKMVEVGESTGALQEMLNSRGRLLRRGDRDERWTASSRWSSRSLLVVMGIVIAGLLLALYMPLFQLSSVLAG